MARSQPPLAWFRAFECSARHLSFTAAARELSVTQSAISQQVRSLEIRFGVALFQRRPRGLALTDAGRRLLPDVSAALGTLDAAARAFEVGPAQGLLTVAASVSFNQWFIAPNLGRFLAADPGVRVRIITTVWPDEFKASVADVEIRFGSQALVGRSARRLMPDELIAVAAPTGTGPAAVLETRPLIEAVGTSGGWERWARHVAYPGPLEPRLFVDSHGFAVDLARSGAGIALTSSLIAARSLADGSLEQVHPGSCPSEDGYFLAAPARADGLPQRFEAWLMAEIAGLQRSPRVDRGLASMGDEP